MRGQPPALQLRLHVTRACPRVLTVCDVLTRRQGPRQPQPPRCRSRRRWVSGRRLVVEGAKSSSHTRKGKDSLREGVWPEQRQDWWVPGKRQRVGSGEPHAASVQVPPHQALLFLHPFHAAIHLRGFALASQYGFLGSHHFQESALRLCDQGHTPASPPAPAPPVTSRET